MNNISNVTGNYKKQAYIKESGESKRKDKDIKENRSTDTKNDIQEDKVSISDSSKEMHVAKNAVASAADPTTETGRTEKVEKIKQEVQEGRYEVNADKVAEKIVDAAIDELI